MLSVHAELYRVRVLHISKLTPAEGMDRPKPLGVCHCFAYKWKNNLGSAPCKAPRGTIGRLTRCQIARKLVGLLLDAFLS